MSWLTAICPDKAVRREVRIENLQDQGSPCRGVHSFVGRKEKCLADWHKPNNSGQSDLFLQCLWQKASWAHAFCGLPGPSITGLLTRRMYHILKSMMNDLFSLIHLRLHTEPFLLAMEFYWLVRPLSRSAGERSADLATFLKALKATHSI